MRMIHLYLDMWQKSVLYKKYLDPRSRIPPFRSSAVFFLWDPLPMMSWSVCIFSTYFYFCYILSRASGGRIEQTQSSLAGAGSELHKSILLGPHFTSDRAQILYWNSKLAYYLKPLTTFSVLWSHFICGALKIRVVRLFRCLMAPKVWQRR